MKRRGILTVSIAAAALVWAATVAAAYQAIRRFESTPGAAAIAPVSWPAASAIERHRGEWTLVMLVHPHCSCSRASVKELGEIVEKSRRDLQTTVLVYRPHEMEEGWERTSVYDGATRIRRARVLIDHAREHRAAKRPGAAVRVELDDRIGAAAPVDCDVLLVDQALDDLSRLDARQAQIVELRYFGGLTEEEVATVKELSPVTIRREIAAARFWLGRRMKGQR
jgi:RNA polymerase sigma factor (TIGR02999 family)